MNYSHDDLRTVQSHVLRHYFKDGYCKDVSLYSATLEPRRTNATRRCSGFPRNFSAGLEYVLSGTMHWNSVTSLLPRRQSESRSKGIQRENFTAERAAVTSGYVLELEETVHRSPHFGWLGVCMHVCTYICMYAFE